MEDDAELEAIRQRRMAELKAQYASRGGGGGGGGGASAAQQQQQQQEMEERRRMILTQILTPEARERLSRIALVKPDKARQVEDSLIRAAQTGQLGGKVDEPSLISMLGQISKAKKETKITFQRKRLDDDDDDF
ncbi:Programmed cell death protein 5 [Balamuthia mandrillaris]